ncbi:MAG: hypothetical protein QM831_35470 [Kofleriaceae bacterium]
MGPLIEITPAEASSHGLSPMRIVGACAPGMFASLFPGTGMYFSLSGPPGTTCWMALRAGSAGDLHAQMERALGQRLGNARAESVMVMGKQRTGVISFEASRWTTSTFGFIVEVGPAKLLVVASTRGAPAASAQEVVDSPLLAPTFESLRIELEGEAVVATTEPSDAVVDAHREALRRDAASEPRYPELEAAIAAEDLADNYLVLADALQRSGSPRGELIALQVAGTDVSSYLRAHVDTILGSLAPYQRTHANGFTERQKPTFEFRRGFIDRFDLSDLRRDEPIELLVERVLRHPAGRFVRTLSIGLDSRTDDLRAVLDALVTHGSAIETLTLAPHGSRELVAYLDCSIEPIWQIHSLRRVQLAIEAPLGPIAHDRIEALAILPHELSPAQVQSIVTARLPALRSLSIALPRIGRHPALLAGLIQLASRTDLPELLELALMNVDDSDIEPTTNQFWSSPLGSQLERLHVTPRR